MNISSSESQADSAVAEEADMSGDAVASIGDLRRLCQSSDISNESLGTALNDFCPSDMSERVRVLSDLHNNNHASDEILQYATEFFTRGGEDEAISLLIVQACYDDESDVVLFLIDYSPSAVEYDTEFRIEGEEYYIPILFVVVLELSVNDALGVLNKLLDERLEFVRDARAQPTGDTLLHWAAKHNTDISAEVCRILLQNLPELLSAQNNQACRPFELACFRGNLSAAECILDSNPEVVENNYNGEPVLFQIFYPPFDKSVAFFVLDKLLQSNPEIVRSVRSSDDLSLLHWIAIIEHSDKARLTRICSILIETFPALLNKLYLGCTPLHHACQELNLTFVKCVLDNCPDAIHERSSRGMTPINYIFHEQNFTENPNETIELMRYLVDFDPSVASDLSRSTYPLTRACMFTEEPYLNAGLEVIKLLYDAYPQALIAHELHLRRFIEDGTIVNAVASFVNNQLHFLRLTRDAQLLTTPEDNSGNLPLHTALRRSRSISIGTIKLMVEKSPLTIQMPNDNGSLPLHVACAFHGCPNVAKYLLKRDRRSLFIANHEGDTPLHCACRAAKHDIITIIFSEYSNAPVATRNLKGELPIDLLLSCEEKDSADFLGSLYLLIRADPEPERWMDDNARVAPRPHPLERIGMALCSCFGCF